MCRIELINSLSFLSVRVRFRVQHPRLPLLRVRGLLRERPERQEPPEFVNFYDYESFQVQILSNISLKPKDAFISAPVRPRAV